MRKVILSVMALCTIGSFSSCEKEVLESNIPRNNQNVKSNETYNPNEILAQAINSAIDNQEFRNHLDQLVKNNGVDEFPTVLYAQLKDNEVASGAKASQILADSLNDPNYGSTFFDSILVLDYPYTAITFYDGNKEQDEFDFEAWELPEDIDISFGSVLDTAIELTSVKTGVKVVTGDNQKLADNKIIIHELQGYVLLTSNDNNFETEEPIATYLKSSGFMPSNQEECENVYSTLINIFSNTGLMITIGGNEVLLLKLRYLVDWYIENCTTPQSPNTNCGVSGENCDRDKRQNREVLVELSIPNKVDRRILRNYRIGLFKKIYSFKIIYFVPDLNGNLSDFDMFVTASRKDLKNGKTMTINDSYFRWCLNESQDRYVMTFISESNKAASGQTASLNVPLEGGGSISGTFTYKGTDKQAGDEIIYYCEDADNGTTYSTGRISFKVKEN